MAANGQGPGAIINEVSNGPSGAQEYIELLVVDGGSGACTVDLRGFIVDDNNGDFSCGPRATAGIAQGHLRFSVTGPWSAVPVGALIVLYNGADRNPLIPADDPTDANGDTVYILSSLDPSIEVSDGTAGCSGTDFPVGCGNVCPGTGNAGYGVASYTAGGFWGTIGLRNSGGDAAQVRLPSGAYYHGLSYGNSNMNGGPDGIAFPASPGTARNYFFNDGDYRVGVNYSEGNVTLGTETPGLANNVQNQSFIDGIRCLSILPVELAMELEGKWEDGHVQLDWATFSEKDNHVFVIERSAMPTLGFREIGKVQPLTTAGGAYEFVDSEPLEGENWYQLWQMDLDGTRNLLGRVRVMGGEVSNPVVQLSPNPVVSTLELSANIPMTEVEWMDMTGRIHGRQSLLDHSAELDVSFLPAGLYLARVKMGSKFQVLKFQKL